MIILVSLALILTAVAITLIIVSIVRASRAKKNNQKTHKVGLWVGITMLLIPWICVAVVIAFVKVADSLGNRWTFDRAVVAEAIADKDAEALYELMAPEVMESNDLTEDDLEDFLDQCDIENNSHSDMERYTAHEYIGDPSDPEGNHYRPDGDNFTYTMYYVNDDGGRIFVSGVLTDSDDEDNVGIYYIEFMSRDPETDEWVTVCQFGERP